MPVVIDILPVAGGRWSLAAHDLPDLDSPSATISGSSAELHDDPDRPAAGVRRLVLTAVAGSSYVDRVLGDDVRSVWAALYQPRDRTEMIAFERRIEPRYADYYADLEAYYSGLFEVGGFAEGYLAELIAFRRPFGAAREFIRSHEPSPDIVLLEDECRTLQRTDAPRHVIWLSRAGTEND
jgi:hypothetical protein